MSVVGLAVVATSIVAFTRTVRSLPNLRRADGSVTLPNGWDLKPAGRHVALKGDMPIKFAFTADGKQLVVSLGGYHDQGLTTVDLGTEKVTAFRGLGSAWAGLSISGNTATVSGGAQNIHTVALDSELTRGEDVKLEIEGKTTKKKGLFTAGILQSGGDLYSVVTSSDSVVRIRGSESSELKVGYRPYSIVASPDGNQFAVSNWGDSSISIIDKNSWKETARIEVADHPNELVWTKDGRIFVTCANADAVNVIKGGKVTESIKTTVLPQDRTGATPVAVAVAPDEKTLYVANADNNSVAVIDITGTESRIKGFIPTGWYPSALAVTPDGKRLIVGVGKGLQFAANYPAQTARPISLQDKKKFDYIGSVLNGWLSFVDIPSETELAAYSKTVAALVQPHKSEIAKQSDALKNIKHVLYIIRENRTYDQVFGDMGRGNGDPEITLFGREVTPNAHGLANEFVLLDNLYCDGEVSEDGHQWCNASYVTDFTTKAWINSYSGRTEPDADDRLTSSPAGYIWDNCAKHGVTFRSYGEFASFKSTPDSAPVFTGNKGLAGHAAANWGGRDTNKAQIFIEELKEAEKTGKWPQFMVMGLGEDHTSGLRAGGPTPKACVASNDLAVGKIVEAVSHSQFWKETAIFIIEDDAQNGPDHVDAHRTVGLVISPYIKRHVLDSTHYTTSSMVQTMERILGLPPMTQYDEYAMPMNAAFTSTPDLTPYSAFPAKIDLDAKNPKAGELAKESAKLDFSNYDRADPNKLNEILWRALKPGKPMPAPVRSSASLGSATTRFLR